MNTTIKPPSSTPANGDTVRLQSHWGGTKTPFSKYQKAASMYDSTSQRDLYRGLLMWLEVGGLALVCGASGTGKTITLRRFANSLDDNRYAVYIVPSPPATPHGFLRTLCRRCGLEVKHFTVDLFDTTQRFLINHEKELGTHPVLIVDDAEGLYPNVADLLRRLTVYNLDDRDRFSVLVSGIDNLLQVLEMGLLEPLRTRFTFGHVLRPFGLKETTEYILFHLKRAGIDTHIFDERAIKRIFQLSAGKPRTINQLCLSAMIQAAIIGVPRIDEPFFKSVIAEHPLFHNRGVTE